MKKNILSLLVISALGTAIVGAQGVQIDENTATMVRNAVAQEISSQIEAQQIQVDLNEAISLALANNHELKEAKLKYEAAEAKVGEARGNKLPTISLGGKAARSASKAQANIPNLKGGTDKKWEYNGPITDTYGAGFNLSWNIYTGGLVEGGIEAAKLNKDMAAANVKKVEAEVKLKAAKAYFDALKARNMAEIADMAVDDLQKHLKTVKLQYEVGVAAKSDVLATEVALANIEIDQIKAHNAVNLTQAALAQVMAQPVATKIEIKDKEFIYKPHNISLEKANVYALNHRPEVFQAIIGSNLAQTQIKVASAEFKPKMQVVASENWGHKSPVADIKKDIDGHSITIKPTGWGNDWNIGVQASWNLWDGGVAKNKLKQAESNYEAQKEFQNNAISMIMLNVRQEYLNLREAEGMIKSSKAGLNQGAENFRIATLRYSAGVGTNLDVLDAELNLNKVRNNYINSLYAYNMSVASLEKAIGAPVEGAIGDMLDDQKLDEANKQARK